MVGNAANVGLCLKNAHVPLLFCHLPTGSLRRSDKLIGSEINNSKMFSITRATLFTSLIWMHMLHVLNGFTRAFKTRGLFCLRVDRVETPVLGGPRGCIRKPAQQREHHPQAKRSFKKEMILRYIFCTILGRFLKVMKFCVFWRNEARTSKFWCYGSKTLTLFIFKQ